MKRSIISISLLLLSSNVLSDTVHQVYSCGNDLGIQTKDNGWLVVVQNTVGSEVVNRIMSISLTLLSTQKPIGYYNASTAITWCGIPNAKPITVLAIKAN